MMLGIGNWDMHLRDTGSGCQCVDDNEVDDDFDDDENGWNTCEIWSHSFFEEVTYDVKQQQMLAPYGSRRRGRGVRRQQFRNQLKMRAPFTFPVRFAEQHTIRWDFIIKPAFCNSAGFGENCPALLALPLKVERKGTFFSTPKTYPTRNCHLLILYGFSKVL